MLAAGCGLRHGRRRFGSVPGWNPRAAGRIARAPRLQPETRTGERLSHGLRSPYGPACLAAPRADRMLPLAPRALGATVSPGPGHARDRFPARPLRGRRKDPAKPGAGTGAPAGTTFNRGGFRPPETGYSARRGTARPHLACRFRIPIGRASRPCRVSAGPGTRNGIFPASVAPPAPSTPPVRPALARPCAVRRCPSEFLDV